MKYLLILLFSINCHAAEYKFTFHVQEGQTISILKYKTEMNDKWEALKDAGIYCGKYFGLGKKKLTEDQINDIIDGCTNPVKE